MRFKIAATVALLACGLVGTAQDAKDGKYVSKDGGYSVRFPAGAEVKTKTQDAPGGLKMVMAVAEQDKKSHVAMFMALPPGTLKSVPAKTILDGAAKGALEKSGGKEVSQKDFEFGPAKHPARELVVDKDGMVVKTHIIVADPRVFVLVVGGPGDYANSTVASGYLKSFELLTAAELALVDRAKVVLKVPDGARVYLKSADGKEQEMPVEKSECRFNSANTLQRDKPGYHFTVRVTHTVDGRSYSETRKLRIFANTTTEADMSDLMSPSKKLRTFRYWCEVGTICNEWMPKGKDAKLADFARAFKQISAEIGDLSVRSVDEDAIGAAHDLSAVLTKMAKYATENDGIGRGGEAFLRGLFGDPLGVALEVAAEQRALKMSFDEVTAKLQRNRALLSSRYDLEFPKLD